MTARRFLFRAGVLAMVLTDLSVGRMAPPASLSAQDLGYHQTAWREWPGEPRLDKAFPASIGAELLPAPPGKVPAPLARPALPPAPNGALSGLPGLPVPALSPSQPPVPPAPKTLSPEVLPNRAPVKPEPVKPEPVKPMAGSEPAKAAGVASNVVPTPENSGLLTVCVPYEAKVTINGLPTTSKGSQRLFVSSGLKPGLDYAYEVRAQIVRDGQSIDETRNVVLRAGAIESSAFGFDLPGSANAALSPEPPPEDGVSPPMQIDGGLNPARPPENPIPGGVPIVPLVPESVVPATPPGNSAPLPSGLQIVPDSPAPAPVPLPRKKPAE